MNSTWFTWLAPYIYVIKQDGLFIYLFQSKFRLLKYRWFIKMVIFFNSSAYNVWDVDLKSESMWLNSGIFDSQISCRLFSFVRFNLIINMHGQGFTWIFSVEVIIIRVTYEILICFKHYQVYNNLSYFRNADLFVC